MENLSQNELIGLVTHIREKKEYQNYIRKNSLLRELHRIVHHGKDEKNRYYGEWSIETRNYVIHQILYRIIPEEERSTFIKDHPLEKQNRFLKERVKDFAKSSDSNNKLYVNERYQNLKLKAKIYSYEECGKADIKETADLIENLKKELNIRAGLLRHISLSIIDPLIYKGWIKEKHLSVPTDRSGYEAVWEKGSPVDSYPVDFIYCGSATPFTGVTNGDILGDFLPFRQNFDHLCNEYDDIYYMNEKYIHKIKEQNKIIKKLEEENKNLRNDNIKELEALLK
jgi:hypothetical protein